MFARHDVPLLSASTHVIGQTADASIVCPLITRKSIARIWTPQPAYSIFVAPTSAMPAASISAHDAA